MSLRVRFALWAALLMLGALLTFGAFVYFRTKQSVIAAIDDSLYLSASQTIATINIEEDQIQFGDLLPEGGVMPDLRERGLTVRVVDSKGQELEAFGALSGLAVDSQALAAALAGRSSLATMTSPGNGEPIRILTVPVFEGSTTYGIIQVAQSLGSVSDTLERLLSALMLGGPLLVLAVAGGGFFLASRALAPIDHIIRTARRISAEDLTARINLPAKNDEVGRLASTFDEMLARLDESFRRERQFTADASHELRTPLAAMQSILSVTRAKRRKAEDYELAMADLAEEADRLGRLAESLMQLARGETRGVPLHDTVDISALLRDVADALRPLADAKGLYLTIDIPDGLVTPGDSDALVRLFVNLVENAVKFTASGGVELHASGDSNWIHVAVADTGIGISPADLPHVFDRFYRADTSRSSVGIGLGLAIASEIARVHGGSLRAQSTLGVGTVFYVELPQMKKLAS